MVKKYVKKPVKKTYKPSTAVVSKAKSKGFGQGKSYGVKPEPFPRVLITRSKFASHLVMGVPAFGVATYNTYRANTIWDPDLTNAGKTVVGWNILNSIYGRYLVTGCAIDVQFTNPSADGIRVGIRLRQANSLPIGGSSTMQDILEQPGTYSSGINNTGSQKKSFKFFVTPWSLFGIDKLEYMANSSGYSSLMAAMPTAPGFVAGDGCVFDIFAINEDSSASASQIVCDVKLTYYVKCYNRLALSSNSI